MRLTLLQVRYAWTNSSAFLRHRNSSESVGGSPYIVHAMASCTRLWANAAFAGPHGISDCFGVTRNSGLPQHTNWTLSDRIISCSGQSLVRIPSLDMASEWFASKCSRKCLQSGVPSFPKPQPRPAMPGHNNPQTPSSHELPTFSRRTGRWSESVGLPLLLLLHHADRCRGYPSRTDLPLKSTANVR